VADPRAVDEAGRSGDGEGVVTASLTPAPGGGASIPVAVLMPVKGFHEAKVRLAPALDPAERDALARRLAALVLAAARPLPTSVVCDDPAVRQWAEGAGAGVIWTPGLGLNGAVSAGVDVLAAAGVATVVVAHADLPLARDLGRVVGAPGVILVPDRHEDGTNVAVIPAASGFRFAYGPGSFARHVAEAERLGLPVHVLRDPDLGWDVDVPADLARVPWEARCP
jgi:2-phospho-L-lactate/phosphoenolpyruvate guanylyltransferase